MNCPSNLLLITIDCLRSDHVGYLGYPRPTTPTLDRLSKQGVLFRTATSVGTPTFYAFPGILCSQYPLRFGRDVLGLLPNTATLATVMNDAGAATAAFVAGNPYLTKQFGYAQGFHVFDEGVPDSETFAEPSTSHPDANRFQRPLHALNSIALKASNFCPPWRKLHHQIDFYYSFWRSSKRYQKKWERAKRYPTAEQISEKAITWLRTSAGHRFFLWLHFMDPHHPRYPSGDACAAIGASRLTVERQFFLNAVWKRQDIAPGFAQELLKLYDAGVRTVDDQIAVLLNELQTLGLLDKTMVAVLGDHGEEFFEHGALGHLPPDMFQETLQVPLLIHLPEFSQALSVDTPFSILDLPPTLLDMMGLAIPGSFQGSSRWSKIANDESWDTCTISEAIRTSDPFQPDKRLQPRIMAIRDGQYKLIVDFSNKKEMLFDLVRDPAERAPLSGQGTVAVRRRLLLALLAHLQRSRTRDERWLIHRVSQISKRLSQSPQSEGV